MTTIYDDQKSRWQPNLRGRHPGKNVQHFVQLLEGRHYSLCNQWSDLPLDVQSWEYPDLPICVRCLQTSGQLRRLVVWVKPDTIAAIKKEPRRMAIAQAWLDSTTKWDDADWDAAERILEAVNAR
jgi:hypothetical protein